MQGWFKKYVKIYQSNTHINSMKKKISFQYIQKNILESTLFHVKNTQQTKYRKQSPQPDKRHCENPQL